MQSKGAIRLVAILLVLACLWQLSFTLVSSIHNKRAEQAGEEAAEAVKASKEFSELNEAERAGFLNSVKTIASREYIDSLSKEKVYFGYNLKDVRAKEINLGLDLKGGMNVMLQVQLEDLIKALAKDYLNDPKTDKAAFMEALAKAKENQKNSRSDLITLFAQEWKNSSTASLASVFRSFDMKDRIDPNASDDDVVKVLKEEAESAISNSFNVLRNRIDRFGVTQPSIQKVGNSGRILIELPGVKDPERVRKLLQGTASLEFWTTFDSQKDPEIVKAVNNANAHLAEKAGSDATGEGPLFALLDRKFAGACIGTAHASDTASINRMLIEEKALFPAGFRPMWSAKPEPRYGDDVYELVAIKVANRDGRAPLDGDAVTEARVVFDNGRQNGTPSVSMTMNAEGANIWAKLTGENVGKQVAIVLDGTVYSYPTVQGEISGGQSSITGNFTVEEATDLVNVLKSGKLPAPASVSQSQVVGPSLGAQSIHNGLISFIIAFVLVLLYMLFFYRGAGVAADIALLVNVILLFGTLASFGAVLTLPGIAGLVLTLGMAVDANVIIYERVKEEIKAGKGLGKAVHDGYNNAYSAIIDGQVTTLLTGLVLFFFGTGPIKGFATTLIIGIVTSVLSSIFITRLIFERRISKGKNITFENNLTKNFLKNTHVNFIGGRKISYIVSGALIVIAIVSIFAKGFTYGVDFTGGRTYVVLFDQPVQAEKIREAVINKFNEAAEKDPAVANSSAEVKQYGDASQMKITTSYKVNVEDSNSNVDAEIVQLLYDAVKGFYKNEIDFDGFKDTATNNLYGIVSSDQVGASIANDIKRSAIISVLLALLIIFGYIALRFKGWTWGLGGVVSLAHTAIIIIGFFSLFSGILPFNLDVDQTFIAAILTIIGYAINDNVVIFDRIRENLQLHPNGDFKENVNTSLNQTLTRTVNTSVSTLLPMVAIAIWGGESIRGLAVALILGICIGTYASIMIGTPIMYDATMKKLSKKASK